MFVPSPTSRTGKRVYLSLWDLFWALVSPIVALYVRDPCDLDSARLDSGRLLLGAVVRLCAGGFFCASPSGRDDAVFFGP